MIKSFILTSPRKLFVLLPQLKFKPIKGYFLYEKDLGQKGGVITNKTVEDYTVGVDYLLDLQLLPYDIKAV